METLSCPTCRTPLESAGRTESCPTCDGAWIHEEVLVGMLQESTSALVELPWTARTPDRERGCAACGKPMQSVALASVALDRCAEHGVWFDKAELAALFHEAKQFKTDAATHADPATVPHHGWFHAIARLFGR